MTRQQADVFELLRGLATERDKFHDWYQGAIQTLSSGPSDKLAQAAHSIRELCDKLPDRIADIPKFNSPVPPVKSLQRDFLDVKTSSYAEGWKNKTINKRLAKLLLRLEEIFNLFNEPPRTARLKMALTASDLQAEFMSKEHRESRDETFERIGSFFQDVTHHKRTVDETEFRKELQLFESLLLNYLTPCTATQQKELMLLIAGPPNPEALARVNELISHKGANYVFFFDKLDNPSWLGPLEQQGHFADLPQPEPISDGRIAYRIHVPLITLAKLAARAPQDVTSILIKLKLPDNSRIGDQLIQCMSKIPHAACIQQLRPLIAQLGENSTRTSWLSIQELLKSWMELKVFPEILAIVRAYINSAVDKSLERNHDVSGTWLTKQVDEQCLEELTAQGESTCPAVLPDRGDQLFGALGGQAVVSGAQTAAGAFALVLEANAPIGALDPVAIGFDTDRPEEVEFPFAAHSIAAFYAIISVHDKASYAKLWQVSSLEKSINTGRSAREC
jgi:hypothetical protein